VAEPITYPVTARLVTEVIFTAPADQNINLARVPIEDLVGDGDDVDRQLIAKLPPTAWGWVVQERFVAEVEHDGKEHPMSSVPISETGTTFVNGRMVTRAEVEEMVDLQEKFRQAARRSGRVDQNGNPLEGLPFGRDKRPIITAFDAGELVVFTRHGNYRTFDPLRDRVVTTDDDPDLADLADL
jgi:hypothetical protein